MVKATRLNGYAIRAANHWHNNQRCRAVIKGERLFMLARSIERLPLGATSDRDTRHSLAALSAMLWAMLDHHAALHSPSMRFEVASGFSHGKFFFWIKTMAPDLNRMAALDHATREVRWADTGGEVTVHFVGWPYMVAKRQGETIVPEPCSLSEIPDFIIRHRGGSMNIPLRREVDQNERLITALGGEV